MRNGKDIHRDGHFWKLRYVCTRSAPINLEDIGTVHFRLQTPGAPSTIHLLRADVKLGSSTIFVYISPATEGWPFIIENDSDFSFTFWQIVSEQ